MARSYKIHKSYHTSHHNTTKNHPKNSTSLQASSNAPTLSTSRQTTNNLSLSSQPSSTVRDLQQKSRCFEVSLGSYLACEVAHGEVPGSHKPQGKAHLSEPGTHQRTWRVMGRPARQKAQTLSMPRRNDRTRHDHAAAPLADCPFVPPSIHPSHPHKKRAPRSKHPGTLPKLKYPIIINRYQLSPTITQHAAETSESPSHWKPSRSQHQDS